MLKPLWPNHDVRRRPRFRWFYNPEATAFIRAGMIFIEPVYRWRSYARNVFTDCACKDRK